MSNNNHKNSNCAFADEVISYLYGEIGFNEKTGFEAHLTKCSSCVNELSELGFVRSSVQEWRKEEFSNLSNLSVNIPFQTAADEIIITQNDSWFANLRRLFAFSPAQAALGFSILLFCASLVFFVIKFTDINAEVAGDVNKQEITTPTASKEESQKITVNTQETAMENALDKSLNQSDSAMQKPEIKNVPRANRENSVVKIEDKIRIGSKAETAAVKMSKATPVQKKTSTNVNTQTIAANNQQNLKLTNFVDVEDNTLRLFDLIAEVDDNN